MRTRLIAAVSAVAATALLLTGCSGEAEPEETTPSAEQPDASSSCLLDAQSGSVSDAIVVSGEGSELSVSIPEDTDFEAMENIERTVVSDGSGEEVLAGDVISVRYRIVSADDGSVLDSTERGEGDSLATLLNPQYESLLIATLECQPVGTSIVSAIPSSMLGGPGSTSLVVYAEALEHLPAVATGTPVDPVKGMPEVVLDETGAPTITIPDADAPTETQIAVLKQGDGTVVGEGDLVAVQYRGVKWSDGEEFDSSWSRGATPAQFPTNGVVTGFRKALEGQQVGSQVIVVMTPEDGYGADETSELKDETLVFVIDIVATTPLEQQ